MQEDIIDSGFTAKKLYKVSHIYFSTFLGGPLAGAYLLSENYKSLNNFEAAKRTWFVVVLFCVGLILALVLVPLPDKVPNFIVPLAYSLVARYFAEKEQKIKIEQEMTLGAVYFSIWRVLLITLISFIILTAILLTTFFLFDKL
jgi:hypothetical protein